MRPVMPISTSRDDGFGIVDSVGVEPGPKGKLLLDLLDRETRDPGIERVEERVAEVDGVFGEEAQDGLDLEVGPALLHGLQPGVPGRREQQVIGSDPHLVRQREDGADHIEGILGFGLSLELEVEEPVQLERQLEGFTKRRDLLADVGGQIAALDGAGGDLPEGIIAFEPGPGVE